MRASNLLRGGATGIALLACIEGISSFRSAPVGRRPFCTTFAFERCELNCRTTTTHFLSAEEEEGTLNHQGDVTHVEETCGKTTTAEAGTWNYVKSRRETMASWVASTGAILGSLIDPEAASADDIASSQQSQSPTELVVKTLPSGVKLIDLKEGTGPTPKYGQLISIGYKGYIRVGTSEGGKGVEPPMFDQVPQFLVKHGNGRVIAGLDEGIHTVCLSVFISCGLHWSCLCLLANRCFS
jgi:FKBP-type peptidyl-prolyl cis-trans isomerase